MAILQRPDIKMHLGCQSIQPSNDRIFKSWFAIELFLLARCAKRDAMAYPYSIAKSFALEIRNPKCLLAGLTGCAIFSLGRKYKRLAAGIL
jgi:hypothetical protein